MENKKKVAVIFTGGTISMTIDPELDAAIPSLSGEEIVSLATNINKVATIEVHNFDEIPSPHMTLEKLMELKNLIKDVLAKDDISGVVVTHGTDSLEESAYFLDLITNHEKPIVVTGAMRNSSELGYDGSSNLSAAVCTAASNAARGKGVLVAMNNEVMLASEVTKIDTLALNTFQAPSNGPLGIIDCNHLILLKNATKKTFIDTDKYEPKVALIKSALDMGDDLIRFVADSGYKGLVIEGMGRGNIPPQMYEGIKYAREKGLQVVLVSRCLTGRVYDSYGYLGSGRDLRNAGCIFAGDLPGQKARIKLMLALGKTNDTAELKEIFEKEFDY